MVMRPFNNSELRTQNFNQHGQNNNPGIFVSLQIDFFMFSVLCVLYDSVLCVLYDNLFNVSYTVYMKTYKVKVKVAPVNLIYGSHFSVTEATCEVSQNMENFVESLYLQEVDVNESPFM